MTEKSFRHPADFIALWFGTGLSPKAPGTMGTAAALPFAWILWQVDGVWGLVAGLWILFPLSLWAVADYLKRTGREDPGEVVVDEVAGMWLTLLGLGPWAASGLSWVGIAAGFALFRLFDIWKPLLVGLADRKVKGALGVMLDDMIAGVYAGAILWGVGEWIFLSRT